MAYGNTGSATTLYIQRLIRNDYDKRMREDLDKLLKLFPDNERKIHAEEYDRFLKLFQKYISKSETALIWEEIETLPRGSLLDYSNFLVPDRNTIKSLLNKLVVVKLNGGLGTRMKCDGPKSLIPVRNELTFLDISVQQIEMLNAAFDTNVPLVLMNSFNTKQQTEKMLHKYRNLRINIYTFMQNCYPRVYAESLTLLPNACNYTDPSAWYPPGHGNFYEAFHASGLIPMFKEQGKEYCFVSNIDNLGAIVDFRILNHMVRHPVDPAPEFIMEVTDKTAADIKGGTLIRYKGKLKLLEYAEVPRDRLEEFKCTRKFDNFNTNNLWMNLDAISRLVAKDQLSLDVIANRKQIYENGSKVDIIQLETASGDAFHYFDGAIGILVPRSRFLPVKSTSDLFLIRSNVFTTDNGKLIMNPLRPYPEVPLVSLANEHFGDFRDIDKRFEKIPDCLNLRHLTISGNVYFGKDVILRGNVTIVANNAERIDIPRGAVLHYKIVTGSLRIVDY